MKDWVQNMILKKDGERAKKRRRQEIRKYGQAKLKHSGKGIKSCFVAAAILSVLLILLSAAYIHKGTIGVSAGFYGLLALVSSIYGVVTAAKGLKERNKNYITCKAGLAVNGFLLLGFILIFVRGFF